MTVTIILLIAGAYLLGSVSNAVWIGKYFYNIDVREHGSRNAGATNTLRVLGTKAGITVFALDFLKGFAAVSLAWFLHLPAGTHELFNLQFALTAAAVTGHIFPIFAHFRGGKGVATVAGAVMAILPVPVLLCLASFALVFIASHYVSLASMISGILLPVYTVAVCGQTYTPLIIFCCTITALLIITHRKNIIRLWNHSEPKTFFKKHPSL